MSFDTRPPGAVGGIPERPAAPTPVAGVGAAGAGTAGTAGAAGAAGGGPLRAPGGPVLPGSGIAASALRDGTLDLPQALRVYAEEVRGLVVERLGAARAEALPRLPPDLGADAGNSAALLLRWLRSAAQAPGADELPWTRIVDLARARTERVAAGGAFEPALRAVLANARDALLRGVAGAATPGGGAAAGAAAARGATDPRPAAGARPEFRPDARLATAAALAARPPLPAVGGVDPRLAGSRPGDRVPPVPGVAPRSADLRGEPTASLLRTRGPLPDPGLPRTSADAAARIVDAGRTRGTPDAGGALRLYAEELRGLVLERIGGARTATLPPLPLDRIGGDADEAAAAVARWLRAAGVAEADWPATVQAGHARAESALARAALEPAVRDALALARDLLVRGLAGFSDGDGPAAPGVPGAALLPDPALLRPEFALPVPYGGGRRGRGAGDPQAREARDRIEAIGDDARRRREAQDLAGATTPEADAGFDDDPFARAAAGEGREAHAHDLQGPMDCIRAYFDAFHAGDSAAYAALWVYPACVWADGRWSAYADAAACAAANAAHERAAREAGMAGGRIAMLRVEPVAPDCATVHASFTRERADGSVLAEIECAYTTVRTAAGWRVATCIVK